MNVEIPSHVSDLATGLGAGVPYALKVLAGRLADDPDMGRPSGLPGILTVMVDGDVFEDCPDLAVGYIREPDRVVIRHVAPASFVEPEADAGSKSQSRNRPPIPPSPRSRSGRSPTPGTASPACSSTTPPTPTPRSGPERGLPPSPPWRTNSASGHPSS